MKIAQVRTNMNAWHVVGTCKYLLNGQNNFENAKQCPARLPHQLSKYKKSYIGEGRRKLTNRTESHQYVCENLQSDVNNNI